MAKMGSYCKAYTLDRFREFPGWKENLANVRTEQKEVDGKQVSVGRELTDEEFLYLQENYVVTDGIFIDEAVIFDDVTPEWVQFCKETLQFENPVPDEDEAEAEEAAPAVAGNNGNAATHAEVPA